MNTVADLLKPKPIPFSIEMFPPKGQLTLDAARKVVRGMAAAKPDFISVTCSAGGSGNGSQTVEVAALIQAEASIPSVAHLTCINSTRETIDEAIAAMKEAGIATVLALRGDPVKPAAAPEGLAMPHRPQTTGGSPDFSHACDLIPLLKDAGFCVGAAAYPEGHIGCLDLKADVEHLKRKQDAGADFFITQLFFDNDDFHRFRDRARAAGITRPITCGVMPFLGKSQIERMVFMCGSSLPSPIIKLLARYEDDPAALRQAGIDYACNQLVDLARNQVDGVHVYSMNHPDIAAAAARALADAGLRD